MIASTGKRPSLRRQCALLSLHRSGLAYQPVPTDRDDLAMMREMDKIHLQWPFYGSRRIAVELRRRGHKVNRKRVRRLMLVMGIEAMAPGPSTSRPRKADKKYPYLLRNLLITRPNQVWATDITYIPLRHGFIYLVAIIDWFSRKVLSWRLSNTLDISFCIDALDDALARFGRPEIFNSDQGCQFTAEEFVQRLLDAGVAISRDGKGRCLDNVFAERLWRSLKYEEVYLKSYDSIAEARREIGNYLAFFNDERPHQAHAYQTPDEIFTGQPRRKVA